MRAITTLIGAMTFTLALAACGGGAETAAEPVAAGGERPVQTPPASGTPSSASPATQPAEPAASPEPEPADRYVWVLMETSMGDIVLQLDQERAPVTVENFLAYVADGFYEGTIFHRVIPTFVIQGGGFTADMKRKPTRPPIINEWRNGLKNLRGTISMARAGQPDSATSQFFISVRDNPALDMARPLTGNAAYAVFGQVVAGMDVVDRIRDVPTHTLPASAAGGRAMEDVPVEPVLIERVTRLSPDEAQRRIASG